MSRADKYSEIPVGDPQEPEKRRKKGRPKPPDAVDDRTSWRRALDGDLPGQREKRYDRYILARRVMAVASYDEEVGDWAAYIDAVPGSNHDEEWREVVDRGLKLPKRLAEVMFPALAANEKLKWRD